MTEFLLAAADQPWILAVVMLGAIIDGLFPPFPSEAAVVGLAAVATSTGGLELWLLAAAAALGACLGDNVAFQLGRRTGTARFRWMRSPFMQRAFGRAAKELTSRGVSMILVVRFIPVARVAVNLTAGATGYPVRRFVAVSALSATLWAGWMVGIGVVVGSLFSQNPVLGMLAAVLLAGLLGLVIDKIHAKVRARSLLTLRHTAGQVLHDAEGAAVLSRVTQGSPDTSRLHADATLVRP